MTVQSTWSNWRTEPIGNYTTNSPNLMVIFRELLKPAGFTFLGCRVVRGVRGNPQLASVHSWGAALDARHPDPQVRAAMLEHLIAWSSELELSELHDYAGVANGLPAGHGGYWRAGRGWKPAHVPSSDPNMATPARPGGANWLHIETTIGGWADARSIASRGVPQLGAAQAKPEARLWELARAVDPGVRPWFGHPGEARALDEVVGGIQVRHWLAYLREVAAVKAGQAVPAGTDEPWGAADEAAIRNIVTFFPEAKDAINLFGFAVLPAVWTAIDTLAGR